MLQRKLSVLVGDIEVGDDNIVHILAEAAGGREGEPFDDIQRIVELLVVGRRFRLPDGSSVILGRDRAETAVLRAEKGTVIALDGVPGPTALVPVAKSEADLELARGIVRAWSRGGTGRERYKAFQIV